MFQFILFCFQTIQKWQNDPLCRQLWWMAQFIWVLREAFCFSVAPNKNNIACNRFWCCGKVCFNWLSQLVPIPLAQEGAAWKAAVGILRKHLASNIFLKMKFRYGFYCIVILVQPGHRTYTYAIPVGPLWKRRITLVVTTTTVITTAFRIQY